MVAGIDRYLVRPDDGRTVHLGGLGVTFKVPGALTGGVLGIVEHPIASGVLVPPHTHHREDELSYVVDGTIGVRIGDDEFQADRGAYVYKPRGLPHTFWNASGRAALLVELLWPPDFERFFVELGQAYADGGGAPDPAKLGALATSYDLDFVMDWVPELEARLGVSMIGKPLAG